MFVEYWWKYRARMGKVYNQHGDFVVCKTLVRYTDSGFVVATLWAVWPVICDSNDGISTVTGLSYADMTSLTFCVLFAIAVGFWTIYPLQASGMHGALGCWWYNLTGDLCNHGPMLVCVASRLCAASSSFSADGGGGSWLLPIKWTLAWYMVVFLPWYAITGDELYQFIHVDEASAGTTWRILRAMGTLAVCGGLCALTMLAFSIGQALTKAPGECYFIPDQRPDEMIACVLFAVYFVWLLHAYAIRPRKSDR